MALRCFSMTPWACKRETTEVTELRLTPSMSAMSLLL